MPDSLVKPTSPTLNCSVVENRASDCAGPPRRRGIGYITFGTEQGLAECLASPQQDLAGVQITVTRADNNRSGRRLDDARGAFAGNFPGGLDGGASSGAVGFPRFRPDFNSPFGGSDMRALPDPRPRPDYGSTGPSGPQFAPRRVFVGRIPKDMGQSEVGTSPPHRYISEQSGNCSREN